MSNKSFQPRYKFRSDEEWQEYNNLESTDITPVEAKTQSVGWEAYEDLVIGLINVCRCSADDGCGKLIYYNGLPPQVCINCGASIELINGTNKDNNS